MAIMNTHTITADYIAMYLDNARPPLFILNYCCPVKLKIAQDLSPNSFIIKDSDGNNNLSVVFNHQTSNEILYTIRILWIGDWERNEPVVGGLYFF